MREVRRRWMGDFMEIGGRFRSGISKLSYNIDVSELSKLASSFLKVSEEVDGGGGVLSEDIKAIGVTEEVLAFVRDVILKCGWIFRCLMMKMMLMKIVKARAALTHELKSHPNVQPKEEEGASNTFPYSDNKPTLQEEHSSQPESVPLEISSTQPASATLSADVVTEKHPISSEEVQIIDKSVIQEEPRYKTKPEVHNVSSKNVVEDKDDDDDDDDDWLKEDSSDNVTGTGTTTTTIPIENDEDVSFSDLEEDDEDAPKNGSDLSTKSRDWVQLGSRRGQASGQNSDEGV